MSKFFLSKEFRYRWQPAVLFVTCAISIASADSNAACSQLALQVNGSVVTPSQAKLYESSAEAYWSQLAWNYPTCIYNPVSADEVCAAVRIVEGCNSSFAVRGHGHSPFLSWAGINDGVLVSLSGINDLAFMPEKETVRVGMGNTWGSVYTYLENFQRTAVGGRNPTVGLGLLLGGGLSHNSNQYGFASDNVVEYELVLPNATMTTANATFNPDLFFALKAGSNNFGVITHVTLRTYPLGKLWGGTIVYNETQRDRLMEAFATYQTSGQLDRKSALLSYMGINNDTMYLTLAYFDDVDQPEAFQPFYNIPYTFSSIGKQANFSSLISQQIDLVVPRWTWGATSLYLDNATYVEIGQISQNASERLSTVNGGTMVLMPQPISKSMISESVARGVNPMNLRSREQLWFCINIGWNSAADDDAVSQILLETLAQINALTQARDLYDPFIFLNDAHSTQLPLESYGPSSYAKLDAVSLEVDPDRVFQLRLPGGFKLH